MNKVLFVCTGNTCRSPMCAALFNEKYSPGTSMRAFSAGLITDSSPISKNAADALSAYGISSDENNPYKSHISHTVCEQDILDAEIVYGVSLAHALELKKRFPEYAKKIQSFPIAISDPYGSGIAEYKKCLDDIACVLSLIFSRVPADISVNSVVIADSSMLDEILDIENASFTCPWSRKSFVEAFNSGNITVYAVKDENEAVAGFSCLLIIGAEAELLNIAVSQHHRRKGYADVLMKRMLNDCAAEKVESVYLEVRKSNVPAQSLYEKYGFISIGIRKKYYTNPAEDAVLMKKLVCTSE